MASRNFGVGVLVFSGIKNIKIGLDLMPPIYYTDLQKGGFG